jgi:hypothetical protein
MAAPQDGQAARGRYVTPTHLPENRPIVDYLLLALNIWSDARTGI